MGCFALMLVDGFFVCLFVRFGDTVRRYLEVECIRVFSSKFGPSLLLLGFQGIPSEFLSPNPLLIFSNILGIDLLIYFTLTLKCWSFLVCLFKVKDQSSLASSALAFIYSPAWSNV